MTQREALRIVEAKWQAELTGEAGEAAAAYERALAVAPVMMAVAETVFALRVARAAPEATELGTSGEA